VPEDLQSSYESVIKAAGGQAETTSALNSLAARFSMMELQQAASILVRLDIECLTAAESAAVFLAAMDIRALSSKLQGSYTAMELRRQIIREDPRLAEAWSRIEAIPEQAQIPALARISLLMEVVYLLNRELKDTSMDMERADGSEIALKVLSDARPSGAELFIESGAFSSSSSGLLTEVLEELDFIQKERGVWVFRLDESSAPRLAQGRNLLAYRSASAKLSPLALSRAAENLVKRLGFIVRSTGMYPSGHPAIAPSVEGFLEILSQFFAGAPVVTLSSMGGEMMVNDLQVRRKGGSVEGFLRDMSERGISSISFSSGVDGEMVLRFAGVFNRSPAYIKEHGGLGSLLERREISGIGVDQYRYALVSKDGKVVGGPATPAEDTTLENIIFAELIDRLERGDTLRDLPDEQLGLALKQILQDSAGGAERQRALLAEFVAALDPGILEKGLLARRDIQKEIAWSALRKIIKMRLEELESADEDVRLEAMDRLLDLVVTGIERNKDNTVVQILESVSQRLLVETAPDTLYTGIVLLGVACENLISRGRLSTAEVAAEALERARTLDTIQPDLVSSRRRAFAESIRRIDTPEVGEKLVDSLLSYNENVARQAETLAARIVLRNMTSKLLDVFMEPDRRQRAKAYRIVRRIGPRVLPVLLSRLRRLENPIECPRDPETGRPPEEDWFVSRNIIQILSELRLSDSVEILSSLSSDEDERIREVTIKALFSVDPRKASEIAEDMILDPSPQVSEVAIEVLSSGAVDPDMTVRQLVGIFRARPSTRLLIMRAFRRLSGSPTLMAFLREGFSSPDGVPFGDPQVATEALEVLKAKPSREGAESLRAFLGAGQGRRLLRRKAPERHLLQAAEEALHQIEGQPG